MNVNVLELQNQGGVTSRGTTYIYDFAVFEEIDNSGVVLEVQDREISGPIGPTQNREV